jgi:acetyl esterase/lipase
VLSPGTILANEIGHEEHLPRDAKANTPLVIWVHGGGWMVNDKYADMSYTRGTVKTFIEKEYELASIEYRHSTTVIFPAQIPDCNQASPFTYVDKNDPRFFIVHGEKDQATISIILID